MRAARYIHAIEDFKVSRSRQESGRIDVWVRSTRLESALPDAYPSTPVKEIVQAFVLDERRAANLARKLLKVVLESQKTS